MKISKIIKGLVSKKSIGVNYNNNSIRFSMQVKILLILLSIASTSVILTLHFDSSPLSIRQNAIQINTPWQNNTLKSDITFPIFKSKEEYDIQFSNLGENVGLIGASYIVFEKTFNLSNNFVCRHYYKLNYSSYIF